MPPLSSIVLAYTNPTKYNSLFKDLLKNPSTKKHEKGHFFSFTKLLSLN